MLLLLQEHPRANSRKHALQVVVAREVELVAGGENLPGQR